MSLAYVDVAALVQRLDHDAADVAGSRRMLWSSTTQLQANLVRLEPGERIDPHVEAGLDVLLSVLVGTGTLSAAQEVGGPLVETALVAPAVAVLPAGTRRSLTAGGDGLVYLSAHRRRSGLTPTLRAR